MYKIPLKQIKVKSFFRFIILAIVLSLSIIYWKRVSANNNVTRFIEIRNKSTNKTFINIVSGNENVASEVSTFLQLDNVTREIEYYCNSPFKKVTGSEGDPLEGFKLRMVHVLLRHGERHTYIPSVNYMPQREDCKIAADLIKRDESLKTFVQTMKQFTRKQPLGNYFQNWNLFPNRSKCSRARLTGIGALQHLKLGQYFRDKYLTLSTIFNKEVALTNQIYTVSSETKRTYQSAIAFLYGFLTQSDFNLTTLNISHADHYFCSLKLSRENCDCQYGKIWEREIYNFRNTYFYKLKARNNQIVTFLENSGFGRITPFYALIDLFHLAICRDRIRMCSNDDKTICLKEEHLKQIWEKFNSEIKYVVKKSKNSIYYYIALYPLMAEIVNRLNDHTKGRSQERLVVYLGHDIPLKSFLDILEVGGSWIRYAGRIVLELYESEADNDPDKHYIRILYNGKDVTQFVKFCKEKTNKGLCNFTLLYDFVFNKMLQQFGYTNYADVCATVS